MKSSTKKALIGFIVGASLMGFFRFNVGAQQAVGLFLLRIIGKAQLVEFKTFHDRPGKLYVPVVAIGTKKDGKAVVHIFHGSVFGSWKDGLIVVSLGEVIGDFQEVSSPEIQPGDRLIMMKN